ncbi:MAG: LysM peptidoglycan-binding domain-containing protein [Pirellulales bacterium]|nr:LysM peptidoglycan-binding domain-containing protein [Pirellulales bacterium]
MSSLRPLFTIAILGAIGVYLYTKINEGPHPQRGNELGTATLSAEGVPSLAATGGGATLNQDNTAPAWPTPPAATANAQPALPPATAAINSANSSDAAAPPAANHAQGNSSQAAATGSGSGSASGSAGLPEVPPIPALPQLPMAPDASAAPNTAIAAEAPTAASAATPAATVPKSDNAENRYDTAAMSANASTVPITTLPAVPSEANPLRTSPPDAAQPITPIGDPAEDRYGIGGAAAAPAAATVPAGTAQPASQTASQVAPAPSAAATGTQSLTASWPAIQAALDANDLKQAHQLLTKWHGNETLSPGEAEQVESLLGQLAGTVIYSTEHRLEPPRTVKPGETLETIAAECNVPWQLLAKINSIASPDQVRPGQELKVLRGPFNAVVDLHRSELTLEVDGRYAGTFPITVPPGSVIEGQWQVAEKTPAGPITAGGTSAYPVAATAASSSSGTIVLRAAPGAVFPSPVGPLSIVASGATATQPGSTTIQVSPQDAEDLSDILSIGSRVVVRK